MDVAFELTTFPDINNYNSYKVRLPNNTCVAEVVTYGMCNLKNFKVSVRRGAFEKNNVLAEFINGQLRLINQSDLSRIQSRICKNVTAYSGCATLEFVIELDDRRPVKDLINFLWKRVNKKITIQTKV